MFRSSSRQKRTMLLDQSIADVREMLMNEAQMLQAACDFLLKGETTSGPSVEKRDEAINAGERMVRRAVLEHLALNPTQDLPSSLVLLNVVIYAERIGDYTKELWYLGDRGIQFATPRYVEQLCTIRDKLDPMFQWCIAAFCEADSGSGNKVMERKREIERTTDSLLEQLLQDQQLSTAEGIIYALAARYMRRISAHLSNIASSVVAPLDKIGFDDEET